jgi:hypothetical protein
MVVRPVLIQAGRAVGRWVMSCRAAILIRGLFRCLMGGFVNEPFSFTVLGLRSEKYGTLGFCLGRLAKEGFC